NSHADIRTDGRDTGAHRGQRSSSKKNSYRVTLRACGVLAPPREFTVTSYGIHRRLLRCPFSSGALAPSPHENQDILRNARASDIVLLSLRAGRGQSQVGPLSRPAPGKEPGDGRADHRPGRRTDL